MGDLNPVLRPCCKLSSPHWWPKPRLNKQPFICWISAKASAGFKIYRTSDLLKQLGVRKQLPIKSFDESLLPALFLMVDGYGKFCSLYPEEQETLETIAKEGFALGVFVVLTATTPSSLRANLLNAMGRSLCLRLAESDRSEYPLAVARPEGETEGGIAINHRPGSGICEGWLEFQIAVPAENEIALDSLFQEMQKHWTGEPAQVPVDPTVESGFTWKGP
jgi:hypothetical protein